MGCLWDVLMECTHGVLMGCSWDAHGVHSWDAHGVLCSRRHCVGIEYSGGSQIQQQPQQW